MKRMRIALGKSTREAAREAGLPHMSYVAYETGKAIPPPQRRPALARLLGLTDQAMDDLVEEDRYEVFLRSRGLSPAARAAVKDFVRTVVQREKQEQKVAKREGPSRRA